MANLKKSDVVRTNRNASSLENADGNGSCLAVDNGYRFCTPVRTGIYMLVSVLAMALAVFVPWIAMGRPSFLDLTFSDLVTAPGNAGNASIIALVAFSLFLVLAGICQANVMKKTNVISGILLVEGAITAVAALFVAEPIYWALAFGIIGAGIVAMFTTKGGKVNAIQSGIAIATLIVMVAIYVSEVFYITMAWAFVLMVALAATAVMQILRD